MEFFSIGQMTEIVGMNADKVKNWMAGHPFAFKPSAQAASGKGSRNIYNRNDLYLLGVANEFSKAGFAGKAIGRLLDAVRPRLATLPRTAVLTVWRVTPGGPFHLDAGTNKPAGVTLWHMFEVGALLQRIDERIDRLGR
jgi:DNA-binding transcriptional MerR regulator